jgi:predicted mannosyl-3-phosphoglycerate phosphatase (HAD superfamily)
MKDLDVFKAEILINSYLLPGVADKDYLLANGPSIYFPRKYNPVLLEINQSGDILVNKVGKYIESISATNGYIHVLDNLADVSYVN